MEMVPRPCTKTKSRESQATNWLCGADIPVRADSGRARFHALRTILNGSCFEGARLQPRRSANQRNSPKGPRKRPSFFHHRGIEILACHHDALHSEAEGSAFPRA